MKILKKAIIIAIVILIIIFIVFINNKKEKNYNNINNIEVKEEKKLEEVKSATAFFTVQSCANKYITYVSQDESEEVYKILDKEYINNNRITQNNVLDILNKDKKINGVVTLEVDKMYVEEIDENHNKYYIRGILKEEDVEISNIKVIDNDLEMAIILDFENMIFSVNPLVDGGIFDEKDN